ncbi:major facilitator superfamily protein [Bifidobacterium saguini DSM 23967]|uniref:Major facilitator superfamily protein n=1 Tax=Bifidobacterium saguini DSM 23967 TaxID=1437607 RepID=A0A087D9W8_9BIFI|nr:MFS transporter [Bifidobacterium saguini]KFI92318.1 major facilitator superfamily protein [Bifidobacterium saguini DSM 23967]
MTLAHRRFVVPCLMACTFAILCSETAIIGILPDVAKLFQVNLAQAGIMVSAWSIAVGLSGAFLPAALSGFDRKTIALASMAVFTVCNIWYAVSTVFATALIARIIPAIAQPVFLSSAFTVAAASVEPKQAPKAVSKVMMALSAGTVVGLPLSRMIADRMGVAAEMIALSAISLLAFIMVWMLMPAIPAERQSGYFAQVKTVFTSVAGISLLATVALQASAFSLYAYITEYFSAVMGIGDVALPVMLFVFGAVGVLGSWIAGRMLSTEPQFTQLVYGMLLLAVLLAVLLIPGRAIAQVAVVILWGILFGVGNSLQQYIVTTSMPTAPEFANGMSIAFGNVGIAVGTAVGGAAITMYSIRAAAGAACLFAAILLALLPLRVRLNNQAGRKR